MSTIKKVAIAGGTGNIGTPILEQLLASKSFDVTVLTRETSTATFPSNITVKKVNYEDVSSLTSALQGIDGVVSTLGSTALSTQTKLIDASIAAGVQRFVPSEFGCDTQQENASKLPVFAPKIEIQKYLKEKADEGKISYTLVFTGPFFDWGLAVGFILNVKEKKARVFDGGDNKFTATTLATIGKTVVEVFRKPEVTKNRVVKVKEVETSQNRLIAIVNKIKPEGEWQIEKLETDALVKDSYERLGKGDYGAATWTQFLAKAIFGGPAYGSAFEKSDNEVLGIKTLSDKEVEDLIAGIIKG